MKKINTKKFFLTLIFITIFAIGTLIYLKTKNNYKEEYEYYNYSDSISINQISSVTMIADRAIDISSVSTLADSHTNVFIATIDRIDGCSTIIATGEFIPFPSTYGTLTVLKNIKGETKNSTITFARPGGIISIKDYEEYAPIELIENRKKHRKEAGQENIDLENTYFNYIELDDIMLEDGKTYLFFASFNSKTNIYQVDGAQYSAREIIQNTTKKTGFRTLPDISTLEVKNNDTKEYEALDSFIDKYFK